jgi:hypothetical protein
VTPGRGPAGRGRGLTPDTAAIDVALPPNRAVCGNYAHKDAARRATAGV